MNKITAVLCATLLTGCSSVPSKMFFSPEPVTTRAMLYQGQPYKVQVVDNRRAKHLLEIIDSEGNKQRKPAGNPIEDKLEQNLIQGFGAQGLEISQYAPGTIELSIIQLETIVAQQPLNYEAQFSIEFKITIKRDGKRYFKTFTGHSNRTGVLQSDIAAMEQELNSLAAKVLTNIFNDSYIQQSIKA